MSPELEIFRRNPSSKPKSKTPIVFVHGAFTGAWCWNEHFLTWFADQGFETISFSLRGHGGSGGRDLRSLASIDDYVEDLETVVDTLGQKPILIGHSMGGYLAWMAAESRSLSALVMMAPVPPTGLAAPAMQLLMSNPALAMDVAAVHAGEMGTVDTLHATLFSDAVPMDVAARYISRFQPESRLAVAGLYGPHLPNVMAVWGMPMMVLGAGSDPLIPPAHVHWTGSICGSSAHIYQGMGHGMMLETGWQRVAEDIADWLAAKGF